MIEDVDISSKFTYDGDYCFDLYLGYVDGSTSVDDFVTYLKRYVVLRVRKNYLRKLKRDICEDLVQSVLLELWTIIQKKALPKTSPPIFHAFLNTVIHRKIAKTFKEIYDDAPKLMDPGTYIDHQFQRIPGSHETEVELFLDELPERVKDRILKSARFSEPLMKDAVEYILDRLLKKERVVEPWLRRKYRVPDTSFLVEHVKVLIRKELYELKGTITTMSNAEKREILNAGIEECFGTSDCSE